MSATANEGAVHAGSVAAPTWDRALGAISDVVYQNDAAGLVQWVSAAVADVLGYRPEELVGRDMRDIVHPDDLGLLSSARAAALSGDEPASFPTRFRTVEGDWRELALRKQPLLSRGAVSGEVVTLRDEQEVQAIRHAFMTVMAGNEVLVRARSADELLVQMCVAVVDAGGYAFAWYGIPSDAGGRPVEPVAVGGDDHGYTHEVDVSWDADSPLGQGPTGIAIRTGTTQVRNDLTQDEAYAPWQSAVAARGIRCSITLPVKTAGTVHGALMVYGRHRGGFGAVAQSMLEGLAADIGYGLERLADAQRRLDAEHRFRLMAENSVDVVFQTVDGRLSWVSPSVEAMLGFRPDQILGRDVRELWGTDFPAVPERLLWAESGDEPTVETFPVHDGHGRRRWIEVTVRPFRDHDGTAGSTGTVREVTARVDAVTALEVAEAEFRLIAEHAHDVVVRTDADETITWMSPSAWESLGWLPEELLGTCFHDLLHPDDRIAPPDSAPGAGPDPATELRVRDRRGAWRWMRLHRTAVHGGGAIDTLRDVDAEVRTRLQAAFEARHDPLTGLLNRSGLFPLLESTLRLDDSDAALIAVGIDNLQQVNAAYTHTAGDRVLVDVARTIIEVVGTRQGVARTGDNEFGILVTHSTTAELVDLAERLRDAGAMNITMGSHVLPVTVSIGIALAPGRRAGELVRDAATALHQARERGGRRWEFLDPAVAAEARRSLNIQSGLSEALREGQIVPWFQPITMLAGGEVSGYEALARWIRPDGTVVAPGDFLPVAERTDLIVAVDQAILAHSLRALASLPAPLHVAVNMSAASLANPETPHVVASMLAESGADARRLHLEVTETALLHVTPAVLHAMSAMAELGVTWWVDDFGTGYSSLTHLRDLPIGGLKLDRSFTSGLVAHTATNRRLTLGLLGLAKGLGLRTIAEGVETRDQADVLCAQGWELGQGWLYGHPEPLGPAG